MRTLLLLVVVGLLVTATAGSATAQEDPSGDFLRREQLLGDPGGSRSWLTERGVAFHVDWTVALQSVVDGGIDTDTESGGTLDYLLQIDFDRMGVIPGGSLKVRGESRYGDSVNGLTGQFLAANTDASVPLNDGLDESIDIALTTVLYTQFLSESFGVFLGKIDNLDSDFNEFASGRGTTQFLNANFVFSPATINEPISTLGAGVLWMPNEHIFLSSTAYNLTDSSTTSGFGEIGDGWTWATELYLQHPLRDLPGGMLLAAAVNYDAELFEIESARLVGTPGGPTLRTESIDRSWSAYGNLWQYLWTAEAVEGPVAIDDGVADHRGIGLFLRAGVADEDTNPIEWSVSGGIGGRGGPGERDLDTFGVGAFFTRLQDSRFSEALELEDESRGLEAFYSAALTPAARLTLDLQVLDSPLPGIDTSVVVGLRLALRF